MLMHADGRQARNGGKPEVMNLARAEAANAVIWGAFLDTGLMGSGTKRVTEWAKVARRTWRDIPLGVKLRELGANMIVVTRQLYSYIVM
jgi:hypothetical protein